MKNRNKAPVQVHIKNGDVTLAEDPRHVTKTGSVEFITTDPHIYLIWIRDAQNNIDPPVLVAPHVNGSWSAHGNPNEVFTYSIETLLLTNPRRKKLRKVHTIIIDGGSAYKTRKRPRRKN